jgi:diacylglycerol kinase family enzyme
MSKFAFLRAMPLVFSGRHVRLKAVTVLTGRSVTVVADRPLSVYADGDPLGLVPLELTVAPAAITVMVPSEHAEGHPRGGMEQHR